MQKAAAQRELAGASRDLLLGRALRKSLQLVQLCRVPFLPHDVTQCPREGQQPDVEPEVLAVRVTWLIRGHQGTVINLWLGLCSTVGVGEVGMGLPFLWFIKDRILSRDMLRELKGKYRLELFLNC